MADVSALPGPGEILHLDAPRLFAGGGGAMAFRQLARSDAEVHYFTAVGNDDAAREVQAELSALPAGGNGDSSAATRGQLHAVVRAQSHVRALVLIPPAGDRTIVVIGRPLHPEARDPLPNDLLDRCDGVYFTAEDPELLRLARAAKVLVATARRKVALDRAGIAPDVIVGSASDPRERSSLRDYSPAPRAVVMTEGARGGTVETSDGVVRFQPAVVEATRPLVWRGRQLRRRAHLLSRRRQLHP